MNSSLNVLGISGSLRKKSTNSGLLRAAQQLAPLNKPEVCAHANSDSFDGEGNLVDAKVRHLIADQMQALAAWVRRFQE